MLNELLLGGEAAQIRTIFAEHHLNRLHANRIDRHQIRSADPVQRLVHRFLAAFLDRLGLLLVFQFGRLLPAALFPLHFRQLAQHLLLIVGNPLLDRVVHLQGLLQTE